MTAALPAYRDEFPMTLEWAYLDHASYGPMPQRTRKAVEAVTAAFASPATMDIDVHEAAVDEARRNVAALVGGATERVAFASSASDAMALCASGIAWQAGDNVVLAREDHPSVVYPFLNLARQGVEARFAEQDHGVPSLERIAALIDGRTRAVALSHVQFLDGFRSDLAALGRLCRERDVLALIDATQSMGTRPIDVAADGIDVILSHGYKWLLSSFGLAVLHFSEQALERIYPVRVGWRSIDLGFQDLDYALKLRPGALRYQTGWNNWLGLAAFNASVGLLREVGLEAIARHTLALTDTLITGLDARGYQIVSSRDPAHRSAIVSFTSGNRDTDAALVERLKAQRVAVVLRGRGVRVSPHFYNSAGDVERLVGGL